MKKLLITGASGFIGSFLVEEGLRLGYEVFAAVRKSSSRDYLTDERIHLIELNLDNALELRQQFSEQISIHGKFDYIIHNAGVTKVARKEDFQRVNCLNTMHFVDMLIENDWVPQKFVYISSLAAWGAGKKGSTEAIKLHHTPQPLNLYGKSKLAAEEYIASKENFPYLFIRPTGVYGPREKDYFVFFKMMNRGIEAYIGRTKQYLSFIYVKDLVRCIFIAIASEHVRKAWFVSDGRYYETKAFNLITKSTLKKKTIRLTVPKSIVKVMAYTGEKIGGMFGFYPTLNMDKYYLLSADNWICDTEELEKDLGFSAQYDLESGVKETIKWYKNEGWL
ncbi:MAG: NAD(P)-dependent oxidoreductase [Bacteroidota bacterium]